MAVDRVQRRMAAILAADVVGYSRLMGKDEETTLATLKVYRKITDELIGRYQGRIFGSAGDSVIAEFSSPVEAVRCATEIQMETGKRNADLPEQKRMRFRIGINLGDVVVDGDNLMGDGVNVAARLEALAQPGGICISEAIHAQVRDRLSLDFLDLGEHKVKNIARPVRAYRVPLASEEQVKSPFRGLEVFDFDHADLFFGRSRAIAACIERLERQAANNKPFLLIYGMSGSGKSSLLRAGLLPTITRLDAVAGIKVWRRCLIRPSEGADAIASLASGLLRNGALPELAQERTATELADMLRTLPDRALALIRAALGKTATTAGTSVSQARLVLAVDQMEELFTTETDPASREAFVRLLAMLAGSGFVWVIATIRADFFHRCGEVPGFSALKDGLGSYELLPPTGPEIAQVIREPARFAGLRFEEDAEQGRLEDVLQEAASADLGSLPLLEFVLDALYEAGRERRMLTFAAYRALGGLEGAIARRADEVIDALPVDIQAALPAVLRALTTVRLGDEAITAGPASLEEVAGTQSQAALVNALVAARLLASGEDAHGSAVIRVAHEALLTRWPRAREIVNANREFLETRARLQADARRWYSDRKNRELLLPPGKRLAEAEELLQGRRNEVDDRIVEYIEASSRAQKAAAEKELQAERARIAAEEAATRERLEREADRRSMEAAAATKLARRTRFAAGIALLLAIGAGAGAVVGFRGQQEAIRQAELAEQNASQARAAETQAITAKNQALRNQSLSLALLSQQTAAAGDTEAATLLALEALPAGSSTEKRPVLFEAESALYKALLGHRQIGIFRHDAGVTHATFSSTGDRIVTSSYDKTARVWDVRSGKGIAVLKGHQDAIERAMFSPDDSRVATAARDGTARVWNAYTGEQLFILQQPGDFPTAIFNSAGTRVLTAGNGHDITIWDAKTGKKTLSVEGQGGTTQANTTQVSFSPDGRSFAAGQGNEGTVRIWNAEDGKPINRWRVLIWPNDVTFSPDGTRILVSSWQAEDERLWDASKGVEIAVLGGRHSHKSETHGGGFSHDGRLIATVSLDGTAKLWEGATGELRRALGRETEGLKTSDVSLDLRDQELNSAFSRDDRLLATVSLDGKVRVWDVEQGSLLTTINGDGALIEHVEFNPANDTLLTASHDGAARLWDIDGVLTTALVHKYAPAFAIFSRDNANLLTGGDDAAHLWDVASGREIAEFNMHEPVQSAAFSPDGGRVATASPEGRITIWDVKNGREIVKITSPDSALVDVQFNPKGDILESASKRGTAQLWDAAKGVKIADLKTSGLLPSARFSPDGQLLLIATNDNVARLLRTNGTEFRALTGHDNRISAADFSRDGRLVATGSLDRTARIWSIKDGNDVAILKGHSGPLTDVEFSQDGGSVVTASRDGTARVWSVADGKEMAVLRGHRGIVDSAEFSPNGLYVVTTSSQDRSVRLWAAASGREIAVLSSRANEANRPASTRAALSSDGRIAIVSGEESVQIIRTFQTPQDLIDYAKAVVPRELTPCERQRFFLPVEGEVGDCPG